MNAVSLDSFKSKLDTDWEDEYMYFNKKICRIDQKLYTQLVYSSLLIVAVGALFPLSLSLSLSLSVYYKSEKRYPAVKKSGNSLQRNVSNIYSFYLKRIFSKLYSILILVR